MVRNVRPEATVNGPLPWPLELNKLKPAPPMIMADYAAGRGTVPWSTQYPKAVSYVEIPRVPLLRLETP